MKSAISNDLINRLITLNFEMDQSARKLFKTTPTFSRMDIKFRHL